MIEKISYRGWPNAYRLSNGIVELIVLADVGPRVISYKFVGDENQFYEIEEQAGLTSGAQFRLYGGHRLWVSPEGPSTYYPDNQPATVSKNADTITFASPVEKDPPGRHLRKELDIRLAPTGSRVVVTHRVTNTAPTAIEFAPWGPTMMRAGGRGIMPLPPRVMMDDDHLLPVGQLVLWSYTDLGDPRWRLGTEYIQLIHDSSPQGKFREQMGGVFTPCGWVAYYRRGHLFVKRAAVIDGARYPDLGCNVELFTNPDFLEVETLAPLTKVESGRCATHEEVWTLFQGVPDGNDENWIRSTLLPLVESR